MAYPSNENTGAKNLVDFVVHLRDSEDALKQTITDAKVDVNALVKTAVDSAAAAEKSAGDAAGTLAEVETRTAASLSSIDAKKNAALAEIPETYTNLNKAVSDVNIGLSGARNDITQLRDNINNTADGYVSIVFTDGYYVHAGTGKATVNKDYSITDFIPVSILGSDYINVENPCPNNNGYNGFYSSNNEDSFIKSFYQSTKIDNVKIPEGTKYIRLSGPIETVKNIRIKNSLKAEIKDANDNTDKLTERFEYRLQDYITCKMYEGYLRNGKAEQNKDYVYTDYIPADLFNGCIQLEERFTVGTRGFYGYSEKSEDSEIVQLEYVNASNSNRIWNIPDGVKYIRLTGSKSVGWADFRIKSSIIPSVAQTKLLHSLYKQVNDNIKWKKGYYVSNKNEILSANQWMYVDLEPASDVIVTNVNSSGAGCTLFLNTELDDPILVSYTNQGNREKIYVVPEGCNLIRFCHRWQGGKEDTDHPYILGCKITYSGKALDAMSEKLDGMEQYLDAKEMVLSVIGDSISSDQGSVGENYLAWPKMLAAKIKGNVILDRHTYPGKRWCNALISDCAAIRGDSKIVVVLMGRNDLSNSMDGSHPLGDIAEIMKTPLEDCDTVTLMGIYRKGLETLKNRLSRESIIVCVSSVAEQLIDKQVEGGIYYSSKVAFDAMRQAIKQFVLLEGGPCKGWFYVDGLSILPVSEEGRDMYYKVKADGQKDTTHPNIYGEALMASAIYNAIPPISVVQPENWITE